MPAARHADTPPASYDVEAVLQGDRHAFAELVRQESPRLFRVILRIVRDEDEAQSVLQETFLQAYKRLGTFRRESKLTTWLYAIGINQARAALRKTRRFDTFDEQDIDRLQPVFMNGMYVDGHHRWHPDAVAERNERHRLVHAAIDKLPETYRTVVILRDLEDLSTAEAAQVLGISEGAVRVRLHRARQALHALLADHFL